MAKEISIEKIKQLHKKFSENKNNDLITRAITKNGILNASFDNNSQARLNRNFSFEIKTGKVTNQKRSGRCWEFSLLNTLRHEFAQKYKVKDFELSQNYLFFWDKLERANIFFKNIEQTANKPIDDREVRFYFSGPGEDGGQWAMAASLVEKYGLIPAEMMPDSFNSNNTSALIDVLNRVLRKAGLEIRQAVQNNFSEIKIQGIEDDYLQKVYRIASYALGEPPLIFDFEYRDDDGNYHIEKNLTAKKFYEKFFSTDFDDYVVLTNSPDKDFGKLYSLPSEDNIIGGRNIEFLNTDIENLKSSAERQLISNEGVWFGNDVLKEMDRTSGILDTKLYDTDQLFDIDSKMTKADRLLTGEAQVSHAMTLTGFDKIDDHIIKWKVENSWGEKFGQNGYFVMSNSWFNDFVYEVVVHKKFIDKKLLKILDEKPIQLAAWDPLS